MKQDDFEQLVLIGKSDNITQLRSHLTWIGESINCLDDVDILLCVCSFWCQVKPTVEVSVPPVFI